MTNSYGTGSKITEYENNGMFCSETFQSDKGHATAWKSTHGTMQEKKASECIYCTLMSVIFLKHRHNCASLLLRAFNNFPLSRQNKAHLCRLGLHKASLTWPKAFFPSSISVMLHSRDRLPPGNKRSCYSN